MKKISLLIIPWGGGITMSYLLLLSISLIAVGYYLLFVSPDAPFEEIIKRAFAGSLMTIIGGVLLIIHIFRRSK